MPIILFTFNTNIMEKGTITIMPFLHAAPIEDVMVPSLIFVVATDPVRKLKTFRSTLEVRDYIYENFILIGGDCEWEIVTEPIRADKDFLELPQIHV